MTRDKVRDSNMELLRIISMILVMIVHTIILIPIPSVRECHDNTLISLAYFFVDSCSVVCVNVFVLISGWYGIRLKTRKISELFFQVIFWGTLVYILLFSFGLHQNPKEGVFTIFMLNHDAYWFVKAYVGLCFIAPMINAYLEKAGFRQAGILIMCFYSFQTIYGWLSINGASWLSGGYSAYSFVGLYMLTRYIRLYGQKISWINNLLEKGSFKTWIYCYFFIVLVQALIGFGVAYLGIPIAGRLYTYTNPLVILAALCLVLAFSKLKIQNKFINWVAASCLAVYLSHSNNFILRPYYGAYIASWFYNYRITSFVSLVILLITVVFWSSVVIDKVRISLWSILSKIWNDEK